MNKKSKTLVPSNYLLDIRIANIVLSILVFIIVVAIIILKNLNNLTAFISIPIIISFIILLIISLFIDMLIKSISKKIYFKKINEIDENQNDSYNMYPISIKLKESGLSSIQYNKVINFRITNSLLWTIFGLVIILFTTNFKSEFVFKDIVLTIIIKVSAVAFIAIILDFLFEALIKKNFKTKTIKKIKIKKYNMFTKNKRLYYVPCVIILAFIEVLLLVDFNRTDKLFTRIVIPLELITIINFIGMLIIDKIISKIDSLKEIIISNDDVFNNDYDLDNFDENEREEENEI